MKKTIVKTDHYNAASGNIYLLISRIILLFSGFVIHIFLTRKLGPKQYGLYGLIMSILLWVESIVTVGIPTAYSKAISEDSKMISSVIFSIKKTFIPYCLFVLLVFFISCPFVALVLNDNRLLKYLLIAGIDIPIYGLYYAYLNIINGQRNFFQEALAIGLYFSFKALFVVILVLTNFAVVGALIANILASTFGLFITLRFLKKMPYSKKIYKKKELNDKIVRFGLPYLLYIMASLLLIRMDLWFVKRLIADDVVIGFYTAAQTLSFPLLFMMVGIMTVIFPSFSKAVSDRNNELARRLVNQAMRFALIILLPIISIGISSAEDIITILFSETYLPASAVMKILLFGISLFAIFSIFLNIIAAKNRSMYCLLISILLLPIAVFLNYLLINQYGMVGAAWATTIISSLGLIISGTYLWKQLGAIINLNTLLRVVFASGCLFGIAKYINTSGYWLMLEYFILLLVYVGLLFMLGEINKGDIKIVKESCFSMFKIGTVQLKARLKT